MKNDTIVKEKLSVKKRGFKGLLIKFWMDQKYKKNWGECSCFISVT